MTGSDMKVQNNADITGTYKSIVYGVIRQLKQLSDYGIKGYDIRVENGSYIRAERCGNIMDRYMVVTGTDIRVDNKGQLSG